MSDAFSDCKTLFERRALGPAVQKPACASLNKILKENLQQPCNEVDLGRQVVAFLPSRSFSLADT